MLSPSVILLIVLTLLACVVAYGFTVRFNVLGLMPDITATAGAESVNVRVTVTTAPTDIILSEYEGLLYVGNSHTVAPSITPTEAEQAFTAMSDNEAVATVERNEGEIIITANSAGVAHITISAGDVSVTYAVTVVAQPRPTAPSGGSGNGSGTAPGGAEPPSGSDGGSAPAPTPEPENQPPTSPEQPPLGTPENPRPIDPLEPGDTGNIGGD